jgi:hypothetical protein
MKRLWPLKWRPLLDAWVDVGLFQIETAIWREQYGSNTQDYIIVQFYLLRKWGFHFRLYQTAERIVDR